MLHYPDELLYVLSKELDEEVSELLYQLFRVENPGIIRKVSSDYALQSAIENEAAYVFIPAIYRKTESKLLTDVTMALDIFELDLGPLAKYNIIGKKIYELFLSSMPNGEGYQKKNNLTKYYVLVHDDGGSLLAREI